MQNLKNSHMSKDETNYEKEISFPRSHLSLSKSGATLNLPTGPFETYREKKSNTSMFKTGELLSESVVKGPFGRKKPKFGKIALKTYQKPEHNDGIVEMPDDGDFKGMVNFLEHSKTIS
jgi:hypothetical protein